MHNGFSAPRLSPQQNTPACANTETFLLNFNDLRQVVKRRHAKSMQSLPKGQRRSDKTWRLIRGKNEN